LDSIARMIGMYIGMEALRPYRIAKMNIDLNSQFVAGAAGAIIGAVLGSYFIFHQSAY
jgi:hypothetical protein